MKRYTLSTLLVTTALLLGGCATQSITQPTAASLGGPESRAVAFPVPPGEGKPREVNVLVDEPALKLVTIVLRGGTVLPTHHSKVPVTIMALTGSGTITAGTKRLRLDPAHAVVLAAGVAHAVEPDAGADLVLLIHHLGRAEPDHH
ncbi:MAG: hypothetical protein IV100_32640 [Myxococcales bacterium]|nr:hypothetical protein [Myxococcales bacterium]